MEKKKLKLLVCALAMGLTAGLANADIESGLTGYWSFEEGTGDTTADMSGNGNDGTLTNGPTWEDGPDALGGAISLDGNDDFVDIGTLNASTTDELTISAWAYCEGTGTSNESGCIAAKREAWSTAVFQFVRQRDGKIAMTRPGNYSTFEAVMPLLEWMHITFTCDSSGLASIYLNGILDDTGTWAVAPPSDVPAYIGMAWPYHTYPHQPWYGILDEVRFYDRALTADDVQELYEFRSTPDYNFAPKVDAGDYQSLLWPDDSVQLNATVSDDGKPYQDPPADPCTPVGLTLTWSKISGPGTVVFSDTTIEDPTATFSAPGTYQLELNAFDGEKNKSDTVGIVIRPDNNPIAHWDFDEGSGSVNDDSANNNEGTLAGADEPNWVSGWVGSGSMEFYGVGSTDVSSYVNITIDSTPDPNLDSLLYDITLAAWVNIGDLANTYYPHIVANGNQGWRLYVVHDAGERFGNVLFTPGDSLSGARTESTKSLADGHWHHVVGIYDYLNSKSYLYIDGVLNNSEDNTGLMAAIDDKPVTIGARATSDTEVQRSWNGLIDDVRVYSYSLSAAQIEALAAMGSLVPVVDAGQDQTFSMQNDYLQLDGTLTDDGKPVAATLEWSKTSGPGDVVFSDTAIEDPTATFSEIGFYVLRLTADDTTATVYDEVAITVENPTCQDVIDDGLLATGDVSGPDGTPDCYVNLYDFAAFAGYWLQCNDPQNPECDSPY